MEYDLMFQLKMLSSVSKKPEVSPFRKDDWIEPDEVQKQINLIEEKEEQLIACGGFAKPEEEMCENPKLSLSSAVSSGSSDSLSFVTADSYYDECEDVGLMSFIEEEDKKEKIINFAHIQD